MSSELSGIVPAGPKSLDNAASVSAVPASDCVPYAFEIVPMETSVSSSHLHYDLNECMLTFEAAHSCKLADVFQAIRDKTVFKVQLLEYRLCLIK